MISGKKALPIILLLLLSFMVIPALSSQTTMLQVDPAESHVLLDEFFNITITAINVTNLNNLQIVLTFDSSVLDCTNATIPQDNIFGGNIIDVPPIIDNEQGFVGKSLISDSNLTRFNGSGIIMQIEFHAHDLGSSHLNFTREPLVYGQGTYLQDPELNPISFNIVNGTVETSIEQWDPYPFNVTKDEQIYTVAVFSNSTIDAFTFNETTEYLSFNATGPDSTNGSSLVKVPKALVDNTYFLVRVDDNPIPSVITQNSTHSFVSFQYSHSTKRILIIPTGPGDINGDRKADIKDVAQAAKAFGSYPGHERWDPLADINYDDKVDIKDIAFIAKYYGAIY